MTKKMEHFSANNSNQDENKIYRSDRILKGINQIISMTLQGNTEKELINTCLSVALDITDSQIGFIGEVDFNGLLHEVALSNKEGNQCNNYDKSDNQHTKRDFILNCLYGRIIEDRMSCLIDSPLSCPDGIGMLQGHPSLTSFLGVPLLIKGKAVGVLAVANLEGGYSREHKEDLEAIAPAVTQALRRIKEECEQRQAEKALHDAYEQIQTQSDELQMQSDELQMQSDELQKINETLEEKVKERTDELEEAYNSLEEVEIVRKKEIHHRIKNNLQVISSLLDLQAEMFKNKDCIRDSEVMEAFKESQNRVVSMALIHEELYKGKGFDTLNFSSYLKKLTNNLLLTYRIDNPNVSLNMNLDEDIFFDMDTAIPLGIIVNELISNSLKYAFKGRDEGEIVIKLSGGGETGEYIDSPEKNKNEDCKSTTFTLSISDNGNGIPKDLDIEELDSLGLQLVTSLVDQLDGELDLKRNNGTEFIIRFYLGTS